MPKALLALSLIFLSFPAFAAPSAADAAKIRIEDARIRAVPASATTSAAYFTVSNLSDSPVELIGGGASWAEAVELHQHVMKDGMMSMKRVASLSIPAHGSAVLKPMGYHLMLIGLGKAFFGQSELKLTLKFSGGAEKTVTMPVTK